MITQAMIRSPRHGMRLHWDAENGWILDVPQALPPGALRKAVDWSLPHQVQRFHGLPPGGKKDELKAAILKLKNYEVQQRVVGARGDGKGDMVLFSSNRE